MERTNCAWLSDEELINEVRMKADATQYEIELAKRLEAALAYIDECLTEETTQYDR